MVELSLIEFSLPQGGRGAIVKFRAILRHDGAAQPGYASQTRQAGVRHKKESPGTRPGLEDFWKSRSRLLALRRNVLGCHAAEGRVTHTQIGGRGLRR
jgi:hypothetical protein